MDQLSAKASRLVLATLAQLRPSPETPLAEWIESHVRLPEGLSAVPGPMKLWPYQAGIANAIGDPHIERVVLVKAARIGFTSLLTAALANWTSNDPQAVLVLLPIESDCRDYVASDLEPLFAASGLGGILTEERVGQRGLSRNTILSRKFPGGSLKIIAAHSPRNLRRHTVKILLIDEADAMEASAEGNPLERLPRSGQTGKLSWAARRFSKTQAMCCAPMRRATCASMSALAPNAAPSRKSLGSISSGRRARRRPRRSAARIATG